MGYAHDYEKKLSRLIEILSLLSQGDILSTKELAEKFNTTDRTIQRDMTLLGRNFPIERENRKWKMQEGFHLEKSRSVKEQLVLDILDNMTENIGGAFAVTAHNLLEKLRNEDINPIYTKLNIEDIGDRYADLQLLENAIKNRHEITCHYDSERKGPQDIRLKPLKIANYEGFWYLLGLDEADYVEKCYFKNVSNIKMTDAVFEPYEEIEELLENSLSIWFQSDREPFEVILSVSPDAATYFKRRPLPTQKVLNVHQGSSMELSATITYEMEIIPIVKYWIPHLRVVEPEWLREEIDEELATYLNDKESE